MKSLKKIREDVQKELSETTPIKSSDVTQYAKDSVDSAVDGMLETFMQDVDVETFSAENFASYAANFINEPVKVLDLDGVLARRVVNFISKKFGVKQSEDVERILSSVYSLNVEPGKNPEFDGVEFTPVARGAGPDVGGR